MTETRAQILRFLCTEGRATFRDLYEGTGRGSKTALMKQLAALCEDGEVFEPTAIHFAAVAGEE